jgi:hypothetical protein
MIVTALELALPELAPPELAVPELEPELQAPAPRARPARTTSALIFFRTVAHFLPREQSPG